MEVFRDGMVIRLKNGQDRYLVADQDKESASKSRDGSTKNAQWIVEANDEESVCFKSCYGKYLTASNQPSIPGMIAKNLKVTQTLPEKKNSSHQWFPMSQPDAKEPCSMWFKTPHGSFLRTHVGPPPLGTFITHDIVRKGKCNSQNKKILWHVEVVESPSDQPKRCGSVMANMLCSVKSIKALVLEKQKEKKKNKGMKDEKETLKDRIVKNIFSRKFRSR